MIEIVSADRCTACDICVSACPDNVFDAVPGAAPVIARQEDCQTCYLCELFCPVDALYVSPLAVSLEGVSENELVKRGLMGSFRREMGWRNSKPYGTDQDTSHHMFANGKIIP